ncbi:MAG: DUF2892 domain-containing protein [Anaerolineae bacterium]
MTKNVGNVDKIIRIVLGLVLLGAAIFMDLSTTLQVILFVVAAIALITGLLGTCPLYSLLGFSTSDTE